VVGLAARGRSPAQQGLRAQRVEAPTESPGAVPQGRPRYRCSLGCFFGKQREGRDVLQQLRRVSSRVVLHPSLEGQNLNGPRVKLCESSKLVHYGEPSTCNAVFLHIAALGDQPATAYRP
jgi:hypothetical protein